MGRQEVQAYAREVIRMTPQIKEAIKTFSKVCIAAAIPVIILAIQNHQPLQDTGMAVVIAILLGINDYIRMHPAIASSGILPSSPTPQ